MSCFWFNMMKDIVPCHMIKTDGVLEDIVLPAVQRTLSESEKAQLAGRCMLVRALHVFPVEAIVRGYLAGTTTRHLSFNMDRCL